MCRGLRALGLSPLIQARHTRWPPWFCERRAARRVLGWPGCGLRFEARRNGQAREADRAIARTVGYGSLSANVAVTLAPSLRPIYSTTTACKEPIWPLRGGPAERRIHRVWRIHSIELETIKAGLKGDYSLKSFDCASRTARISRV